MTKRIELNESLNFRSGLFAGIIGSSEGPSIDFMLQTMKSKIDLGFAYVKEFLVEGLLTLGAAMGIDGSGSGRRGMAGIDRQYINHEGCSNRD